MTPTHLLLAAFAYLLGSIPVGVLVARSQGVDIMKVGSGNTGATNVMRTLGKGPGFLVFILDVAKGWAPAFVATQVLHQRDVALAIGFVAILGHSFSPWLKFKGGKGIASGLGAMLGASPLVALTGFATFLVCFAICRWVSLSSIVASVSLIAWGVVFRDPMTMVCGYVAIAIFVIVRHRPNIARLMAGTEPKLDLNAKLKGSKPPPKPPVVENADEESANEGPSNE